MPREPVLPPLLLALLSVPIIFWDLGRYGPVNMDELFYHYVARHMLATGDFTRLQFVGELRFYDAFLNAPLFYWAKAMVIAVLGDGWLAMRLLSAVCGLGSVLVTYGLVRRIESPGAGLLAGLIQLTTFQFVYLHSSRTGEMETAIALLMTLCIQLFLRALSEGRGFIGHHLCLVALAHLKLPLVVPPVAAELAWFALDPSARARFRDWLRIGLYLLPLAVAWRVFQAVAHWEEVVAVVEKMLGQVSGDEARTSWRHGGPVGNAFFYGVTLLWGSFPWSLLHPLALAGLLGRERHGASARTWRLLGVYLVAILSCFVLVSKHFPWYVIPAYPILSAFTAVWLCRLGREGPRPVEVAAVAAAAAVALGLRMPGLAYDPFAQAARVLPSLGLSGPLGLGSASTIPVLAVLLGFAGWTWRRRASKRFPVVGFAASLCAVALLVAGVRVVAPLRFTDYRSPLEELRQAVDAMRARGEAIPYPVEYVKSGTKRGLMKVRYFFGDEFWIMPRRETGGLLVVDLYEKSRGLPPARAPREGTEPKG